jgi:hypothetical protein
MQTRGYVTVVTIETATEEVEGCTTSYYPVFLAGILGF